MTQNNKTTDNKNTYNVEAILENLVKKYRKTYPVFVEYTTEIDHTDDFGSIDNWMTVYSRAPTEIQEKDSYFRFFERHTEIDFCTVDALTYAAIEKNNGQLRTDRNKHIVIDPDMKYLNSILAAQIAKYFHEGQKRADETPYISHPLQVANYTTRDLSAHRDLGEISQFTLQSIAWLHDIVEDTPVTINHLEKYFDRDTTQAIKYLTRDVDRETYKKRLLEAPKYVQLIKLHDVKHNVESLKYGASSKMIKNKVDECNTFYIPLAFKLNRPEIAKELSEEISKYIF